MFMMSGKHCLHGGSSINAFGGDFSSVGSKDVIRSDVADASYDPAPEVSEMIRNHTTWLLRNSSQIHSEGLIETISNTRGIEKENIAVGGGSSNIMYVIFQNLLKIGTNTVTLDPMYGEYQHLTENILNGSVKRAKQVKDNGFKIKVGDILDSISSKTDIITIVNPNNPTGQYLGKTEIEKLLGEIPENTYLLVDEAYNGYIGKKESMEKSASEYENLIVLKSMSKEYALSGVRVGYASAHKNVINKISKFLPPWGIGTFGQLAGIMALKNEDYYTKIISKTKDIQRKFISEIGRIENLKPYDSACNFFLVELMKNDAENVRKTLASKNVFVRNPRSQSTHLGNDFIRITTQSEEQNSRILSCLKDIKPL